MKKLRPIIVFIFTIFIIVLVVTQLKSVFTNLSPKEKDSLEATDLEIKPNQDEVIKFSDVKKYNLSPSFYIGAFKGNLLKYDKNRLELISIDQKNKEKEIFSTSLVTSEYILKTSDDYIYLLDLEGNELYKIDEKGVVISQNHFSHNIVDMEILSKGETLLKYTTDVFVDGVLYLGENLEQKVDIKYPQCKINVIQTVNSGKNVIVSALMEDEGTIVNKLFYYDENMKVLATSEQEDTVYHTITKDQGIIYALDPDKLTLFNEDLGVIKEIKSGENFLDIGISTESIYLLDTKNTIKKYDKDLKLQDQIHTSTDIIDIAVIKDKLLYYQQYQLVYGDRTIVTQNILEKILALSEDQLLLIFRGGLKVKEI